MAHVVPLLKALAQTTRRGLPSLDALAANNFVLAVVLLSYEHPSTYRFLHVLLAGLLLLPLSLDPMRGLPRERLDLLPLGFRDRLRLRLGSLGLSPVLWLAAAILLAGGRQTRGLLWLLAAVPLVANAALLLVEGLRPGGTRRWGGVGILPGRLGLLVQKNLRELLRQLDAYLALLLSALGVWVHHWRPDPLRPVAEPVTFMVVLALSTSAQQLFALDRSEVARYPLLPLAGWQVLLAKNLAFLGLLMALVLFLAPLPGLVAGLGVLAVGNLASTTQARPQTPWTLVRGASLGYGVAQVLLMAGGYASCTALGAWALGPAMGLWAGSLLLAGQRFEANHLRRR